MDSGASREEPSSSYVMCTLCSKRFGCNKLLNRHKKRIHNIVTVPGTKESRIICPICEERNQLKNHQILRKHLEEKHAISIELLTFKFFSIHEYDTWKQGEKIETRYSVHRTNQGSDHKEVNYICNRSDSKGYQSKYKKRIEKSGATIKIQGMCPSQLVCRLYQNGSVSVSFWRTHAGHENELRSLHLSTSEKTIILEKLKSGVSVDRILEDARKTEAPELQRINLINRDDITYMTNKNNINKKRDRNEMVAAALKVHEWNANGQNFAFLYKQLDKQEDHTAETLGENSIIKTLNLEEISQFLQERISQEASEELEHQDTREVRWTDFKNWAESLNDDVFDIFMGNIQGAIREADQG